MTQANEQHYDEWPDESLIEEYRVTSDADLLGVLFMRHRRRLLTFCWCMVHDAAEAEDIVQETFQRAFLSILRYTDGSFIGWLQAIAANLSFNHLRRNKRLHETELQEGDTFQPAKAGLDSATTLAIAEALEQLKSPMQKACLKLFYVEGLQCKEIAEYLGIPGQAVKSHMQNGKRMLRQYWLQNATGTTE